MAENPDEVKRKKKVKAVDQASALTQTAPTPEATPNLTPREWAKPLVGKKLGGQ